VPLLHQFNAEVTANGTRISDPKNKAKSACLSPEGVEKAKELFAQHFGGDA